MTNETNLCDLCEVYALGGLDKEEQQAFEQHLTDCSECQTSLTDYEAVKNWMLYDFEDTEPNPGMKERIFQHIFEDETVKSESPAVQRTPVTPLPVGRRRPSFLRWTSGAVAAVVVAAVIVGVTVTRHPSASGPLGQILAQSTMTTISANGNAHMYVTSAKEVVLQFHNLKPTAGQQVYQVWFINQAGKPVSAGTFQMNQSGSWVFSAPIPSGDYHTVAVTLEPNAGNTTPKGTKQFVGAL